MKPRILSIEDDPTIQVLIEQSLKDYSVVTAKNLRDAQSEIEKNKFDAVLIDIELPDGDGLKFYSKIQGMGTFQSTPTLFLTGHGDISNKIMAFSVGADDFLTKPFDPLELNARLTSKIRKYTNKIEGERVVHVGNLLIDIDRQKVFRIDGATETDLSLTTIEIKILLLLAKRLEVVYTREQILDQIWGQTYITDRTIDSHIAHLRAKTISSNIAIETVKSIGYKAVLRRK